ncbi:Alpha-1,3-mannosyl-glycoprotein 2-beta-N-acetylglucosaminyltransferase, partial [Orchesella cincta]
PFSHSLSSDAESKLLGFSNSENISIAVLVLVCNRITITRTLDQLLKYRPSVERFPIVVSHDCGEMGNEVKEILDEQYGKNISHHITVRNALKHPNYQKIKSKLANVPLHMRPYYHIAEHYGWALGQVFNSLAFDNVIIVEDDLDIASDFFEYFEATLPLLQQDPTLYCVSAYNDNGKPELIDILSPSLLFRTDFFPGLGWMMTKRLWKELEHKWPYSFWDDWMRDKRQRRGRACIHPEISRTKTFGRMGASNGQFYDVYLKTIMLDQKYVAFKSLDLSYLLQRNYDKVFLDHVNLSIPIREFDDLSKEIKRSKNPKESFRLPYTDETEFNMLADSVGIMRDFKDGVPRNGYMGIVPVIYQRRRVYLVPSTFE